jgi:hypothetical protein
LGQITIANLDPPVWAQAVFFFVFALVGYFIWRQLYRWNQRANFMYWFPTLMLLASAMIFAAIDRFSSPAWLGNILFAIAFLWGCVNLPVLLLIGLVGGLWLEELPIWIRITSAFTLGWASWHIILRYMHRRAMDSRLISLGISTKTLEGK